MSWLGVSNRSISPVASSDTGSAAILESADRVSGVSGGTVQQFSYPSGFAVGGGSTLDPNIKLAGSHGAFANPVIHVTNGIDEHAAGGVWYATLQNIQSFTTDFTFTPDVYGFWFVCQNGNATTNPGYSFIGVDAVADANGQGFGDFVGQSAAIGNAVGLKFDLNNFEGQAGLPAGISTTGVYVSGGPGQAIFAPSNDILAQGINLHNKDLMAAHVVYDGSLLTLLLTDTVTGAQVRQSWPINIPAIMGAVPGPPPSNTAFVGFCAGSANAPAGLNILNSWTYSTGFNTRLATPTFSPTPGSYTGTQTVTISGPSGASIYYTINGQAPGNTAGNGTILYTGPFSITSTEVVQAVAVQSGFEDSLVGFGNYQIQASGLPLINLPSGFASAANLLNLCGNAALSGSNIQLTSTTTPNPTSGQVAAAWYPVPVLVTTFTATFTLAFSSANADGMAFVLQNATAATTRGSNAGGPFALGFTGPTFGYGTTDFSAGGTPAGGGAWNSIAVVFDLDAGNSTGLYTGGAKPTGASFDMTSSGVTLKGGHPLLVTLVYNGTTLVQTVKDTVTLATFTHTYTVDIPSAVAASAAYIGFTASCGGADANQFVETLTYATP